MTTPEQEAPMDAVEKIIAKAEQWATIVEKSGNESERVGANHVRALAAMLRLCMEQRDQYNRYAWEDECLEGQQKIDEVCKVGRERDNADLLAAAQEVGTP